MVSFAKLGSWHLLLYVSFVTVTLVTRQAPYKNPRQTSTPTTSAAVTTSASPEAAATSST